MKQKYTIKGMSCAACAAHIEKAVDHHDDVRNCSVSLMTSTMIVEYDESKINDNDIIQLVTQSGYSAEVASKDNGDSALLKAEKAMQKRLIISLVLMLVVMYVAMAHMLKLPMPTFLLGYENALIFTILQLVLCLPVLWINRSYFINGFRNLFKLHPNMDSLIAVGSSASLIYGVVAIFLIGYYQSINNVAIVEEYLHNLYFESAVMILTLVTLGKYLESKSKQKTGTAIQKLVNLAPNIAILEVDGKEETWPTSQLKVGDIVIVRPGEAVSADGEVIFGETYIDESMVTGESVAVIKKVGDIVIAGTINKSGYIKLRVTLVGDDTTLAKIIALVENANTTKAPIAKLADKIAGVFVPIVIAISIISLVCWLLAGATFEFAFSIAIAVLVISCPCALGLATPVAIMVATGKGAENGILIKSSEALEMSSHITTVVFDKTGTITLGSPEVLDIVPFMVSEEELLVITSSLEKYSEHPLAQAVMLAANQKGIDVIEVENFKSISGLGLSGVLHGVTYYVGSLKLITGVTSISEDLIEMVDKYNKDAKTVLIVANLKEVLGLITVADTIRPTSNKAINALQKSGLKLVMLTGDNAEVALSIAKKAGIKEVIANVMPENKDEQILNLQENGERVMFVGDGINDAPALARADVGVAIGAGTDIAIESADVVLVKSDLQDVVTLIELSQKTIVNIKENLFWAFFYNSLGIPLAAGVFYSLLQWKLNPMFAAAAMSLSSLFVVGNALRLKLFKPNQKGKNNMEQKTIIKIDGMNCTHCSSRVESALKGLDVIDAKVNLKKKEAVLVSNVDFDDATIARVIEELGYKVKEIKH